ncbi:MAG TPA: STAS domain-containing protein [Solirubrobacterales bacterium]|nr:STAS domain-containing protein [Solirubrobacterales bacterium]
MAVEDSQDRAGTLSLETAQEGGLFTIKLGGELDLAAAPPVEAAVEEGLSDSGRRLVIDFSALSFIDSTGIAILVAAMGDERGIGRLAFVPSTAPAVTRVLKLTGVEERLPLV